MAWLLIYRGEQRVDRKHVPDDIAAVGGPFAVSGMGAIRLKLGRSLERDGITLRLVGDCEHVAPMTSIPLHSAEAARTATRTGTTRVSADANNTPTVTLTADGPKPPRINGYKIMGMVGAGGMGLVWLAEQQSPQRIVAVKIMREHFTRSDLRRRFLSEVQLAAKLEHAHIVRVYDFGTTDGMPYYTMQYVDGVALDDYATKMGRDQRDLIALMIKICDAVEHAHERGIIHCDLKFTNVLVTDRGDPFVLDLGLARALSEDEDGATRYQDGHVEGTPAFMSPEQAAGHIRQLSTRTDVYSLGVMLYWLIVRQPPHNVAGSSRDVIRRIRTEDIPRPRTVSRTINGELESIILKALARDPDDRYRSAGDFAADLRNYEAGEPLLARPATTFYFLSRRVRQHRGKVSVAAIVLLAGVTLLATSYIAIAQQKTAAHTAATIAIANEADAKEGWRRAKQEAERARSLMYANRMELIHGELRHENVSRARELLASVPVSERSFEWGYLNHLADPSRSTTTLLNRDAGITAACFHDATLYTGSVDGTLYKYDLPDGLPILIATFGKPVISLDVTSDGSRIAASCEGGTAQVINSSDGHVLSRFSGSLGEIRISEDDARFAAGPTVIESYTDEQSIWTGQTTRADEVVTCAIPIPRSNKVLFGSTAGSVYIDTNAHQPITVGSHSSGVSSISVSPDGHLAASGAADGTLRLWNLNRPTVHSELAGHTTRVTALSFAPTGNWLVSADTTGVVRLWDIRSDNCIATFLGHTAPVIRAAFSTDGEQIYTVALDNTAKVWHRTLSLARPSCSWPQASASRHSNKLIVANNGTTTAFGRTSVYVYNIDATAPTLFLDSASVDRVTSLVFSPDDSHIAIAFKEDAVQFLRAYKTGDIGNEHAPLFTIVLDADVTAMHHNPRGSLLAVAMKNGIVSIVDAGTGTQLQQLDVGRHEITHVAFSTDATHLYVASIDRQDGKRATSAITLFGIDNTTPKRTYSGITAKVESLATTPRGALILTRAAGRLAVRNLDALDERLEIRAARNDVATLMADGTRVVIAGDNNTVRIVRTDNGATALSTHIPGESAQAWRVPRITAVAASNRAIALLSGNNVTLLRSPAIQQSYRHQFDGPLRDIRPVGDDTGLLALSTGGQAYHWDPSVAEWYPVLNEHGPITAIASAHGENEALLADADGSIWRKQLLSSPVTQKVAEHDGEVTAIRRLPNNRLLVIDAKNKACVYDATDRMVWSKVLNASTQNLTPAVSERGTFMLDVLKTGALRSTHLTPDTPTELKTPVEFVPVAITIADTGDFAAADDSGHVWVWRDSQPNQLRLDDQETRVSHIRLATAEQQLYVIQGNRMLVYDLSNLAAGPVLSKPLDFTPQAVYVRRGIVTLADQHGGLHTISHPLRGQ